jgi:hypothetical protein
MKDSLRDQFLGLTNTFIDYMPYLLGGILLVIIGWILGWIVKRLLIQLSIILKLERIFIRFRWGSDFVKADVRHAFNNIIGNFGFLVIFLIFLDNAIIVWKITILADLLSKGILFLPKIIIALFVFGVGWFIASWTAKSVLKTLRREDIPRSSLISRFVKSVIIIFFSAMALVVLNIAKEIVIIGFATIIITLGCITIIIVAIGGKKFIKNFEKSWEEEKSENG